MFPLINFLVSEKSKFNANKPPSAQSAKSSTDPPSLANFISKPSQPTFEHIHVSTLKNFVLSPVSSSDIRYPALNTSLDSERDLAVGRLGEEYVYKYLKWKFHEATIEWVNEKQESGKPFDITIMHNGTNKQIELIEVKTTRFSNQNTFPISINEVECILTYPTNYRIYRLYYTEDEKSRTIMILDELKVHLQHKQLALSLTIMEKSDN